MLSFDTNILIYAADKTAGARHASAIGLLRAAASVDSALTHQSLIEFLNIATRQQGQTLVDASSLVQSWLENFRLMLPPASIVRDTVQLLASHRLSIWDAHMLAVCAAHGCDALLSEDMADGALYGGVRVLNPFNPRNGPALAELLQS